MARKHVIIVHVALVLLGVSSLAVMRLQLIQAAPSANLISVTYREQETAYYCGPAVVQMALSCLVTELPSQDQLAAEMETDPVEGATYTDMMPLPFNSRGFPRIYEDLLGLDALKENNADGYLTIILMYFDTDYEDQHYVLVVGYNASGIFVHDPWPVAWGHPEGRTGGEHAFISDELLADLWGCEPPNWGLVIPYPEEPNVFLPLLQNWYALPLVFATATAVVVIYVRRRKTSGDLGGTDIPRNSSKVCLLGFREDLG